MRKWFLGLGTLILATVMAWAAGPMPDTFFVHFTDPVVVSSSLTLMPGNYKFQRMTNPTDPAIFTIINGDTGKTIGTTLSGDLAPNMGTHLNHHGYVAIDQLNGKYYLDSVRLQGMGNEFLFQQPNDVRGQLKSEGGQKIRIDAQTGGQE